MIMKRSARSQHHKTAVGATKRQVLAGAELPLHPELLDGPLGGWCRPGAVGLDVAGWAAPARWCGPGEPPGRHELGGSTPQLGATIQFPLGPPMIPSTPKRAALAAAASRAKSAATLGRPRTRARRPPWRRRIRWPILRSTFGRVAL